MIGEHNPIVAHLAAETPPSASGSCPLFEKLATAKLSEFGQSSLCANLASSSCRSCINFSQNSGKAGSVEKFHLRWKNDISPLTAQEFQGLNFSCLSFANCLEVYCNRLQLAHLKLTSCHSAVRDAINRLSTVADRHSWHLV